LAKVCFCKLPKFVFATLKVRFCYQQSSLFYIYIFFLPFQINNNFFYENGQWNIVDEQGNEAMDLEEEIDPYNLVTLLTLSQYRAYQGRFPTEATEELDTKMEEISEELATESTAGRKYNVYSDEQKAVFYYFNRIKLWKDAPSGRSKLLVVSWINLIPIKIYEFKIQVPKRIFFLKLTYSTGLLLIKLGFTVTPPKLGQITLFCLQ
jgi:hypothetical protein